MLMRAFLSGKRSEVKGTSEEDEDEDDDDEEDNDDEDELLEDAEADADEDDDDDDDEDDEEAVPVAAIEGWSTVHIEQALWPESADKKAVKNSEERQRQQQ